MMFILRLRWAAGDSLYFVVEGKVGMWKRTCDTASDGKQTVLDAKPKISTIFGAGCTC